MPVTISGDGGITGLQLESFEDVDVGSGASDGDVLTYDATGDLWIPQGVVLPAGIGSNVVQTVKTDVFSTTSTSFVDVTGLTLSFTPTSASSKVLVIAHCTLGFLDSGGFNRAGLLQIVGGNAGTYIGDGGQRAAQGMLSRNDFVNRTAQSATIVYLDSPATASPITYKAQMRTTSGVTVYLNRDGEGLFNTASSITAIEVAA